MVESQITSHGYDDNLEHSYDDRQILTKLVDYADKSKVFSVQLQLPCNIEHLNYICKELAKQRSAQNGLEYDEDDDYKFFINDMEIDVNIIDTLMSMCSKNENIEDILKKYNEDTLVIEYKLSSNFKVQYATQCSNSNDGHDESIIDLKYSPSGKFIATGSGDSTVRIWDSYMNTSFPPCKGHSGWIMFIEWSPDEFFLASGCQKGQVIFWNSNSKLHYMPKNCHSLWISCLCWRPLHLEDSSSKYVASSSKDGTLCIYNLESCEIYHRFYTKKDVAINYIRWSGSDQIIAASKDTNVYIWDFTSATLTHKLFDHSHWINCISLNSDFTLRTASFNPKHFFEQEIYSQANKVSGNDLNVRAKCFYDKFVTNNKEEIFATCSDDRTICLYSIENQLKTPDKRPKIQLRIRLSGHQGTIIQVSFSPDGTYLASASFDKSIRIWNGHNGHQLYVLRGHISPIYRICWSPDSRYIISGSADTTVKIWSRKPFSKGSVNKQIKSHLQRDLPGHEDEIYCVDWSPDGSACASGGRDKHLKIWK